MKRRDAGALIIGLGVMIMVMFYVLPVLGVEFPNPFLPSTSAYVSIYASCAVLGCGFDETTTYIGFGKPSPDKPWWWLSTIGPQESSVILSELITTPPSGQGSDPQQEKLLAVIPGVFGGTGVDIAVRFKISDLNYDQIKPFNGFHWVGGLFGPNPNPLVQSFSFNYEHGKTYNWVIEVTNMQTGVPFYVMQGSHYFG
jgi:hypothetical protein